MRARINVSGRFQQHVLSVGVLLASGLLASCSPYAFSSDVQGLSTRMTSIDTSSQDTAQKIVAERHTYNRLKWIRDRSALIATPGCGADSAVSQPCDLMPDKKSRQTPHQTTTSAASSQATPKPRQNVCEASPAPTRRPSTKTVAAMPPLDRAALPRSLDNYFAALAAITRAQDRADFDNAASRVSAAVGGLAQSAASATGEGAAAAPLVGNLAKASANAALWLVGQALDSQRLHQLRIATAAACEPVHTLAEALNVVLEQQRGDRLDGLSQLLTLKLQAINRLRQNPSVSDTDYGGAIDDAQAAADAYQTVRMTDPPALMQALIDTHDQLVVAVRENNGQFAELVASLSALADRANDLAVAAAASAAQSKASTGK
jgi:hypothetical protein